VITYLAECKDFFADVSVTSTALITPLSSKDPLQYKDAFDIYQTLNSQVDQLWTLYCAVVFGLLACLFNSSQFRGRRAILWSSLVGFIFFTGSNLWVMAHLQYHVCAWDKLLSASVSNLQGGERRAAYFKMSTPVWGLCCFHLVCDAVLTGIIIFMAVTAKPESKKTRGIFSRVFRKFQRFQLR
jgi:hypothetical protein